MSGILWSILLWALLTSGCAHPQPQAPAPSRVAVRFSPKGFRVAPLIGSEALVIVTIPEGTPLWCPTIEVDWGVTGFVSKHTEDCKPELAGQPYSYLMRGSPKMTYWRPSVVRVWIHQDQAEVYFDFEVRVQGME